MSSSTVEFQNDLEEEFEVKSELTKVFSSKLNIFDFIGNKLSGNEYQRVINATITELENIINEKDQITKLQFYNDLKNVFNYSFDEYQFIVGFYRDEIPAVINLKLNTNEFKYLDEDSKNEIFFEISKSYNKVLGGFDSKVVKIYINYDSTEKYKNILYTALKNLDADNSIFIHYYEYNNSVYMMLDVYSEYNNLISNKFTEIELHDHNKLIYSYTLNDFVKLWKNGYNLYTMFKNMTDKKFTMCLCIEFDSELKYFKYDNKVYAIDYDKFAKKLFPL